LKSGTKVLHDSRKGPNETQAPDASQGQNKKKPDPRSREVIIGGWGWGQRVSRVDSDPPTRAESAPRSIKGGERRGAASRVLLRRGSPFPPAWPAAAAPPLCSAASPPAPELHILTTAVSGWSCSSGSDRREGADRKEKGEGEGGGRRKWRGERSRGEARERRGGQENGQHPGAPPKVRKGNQRGGAEWAAG